MSAPLDHLFAGIAWREVAPPSEDAPDGLPYATHEGTLKLGDAEVPVYQLSDGQRVIDAGWVENLLAGEWAE